MHNGCTTRTSWQDECCHTLTSLSPLGSRRATFLRTTSIPQATYLNTLILTTFLFAQRFLRTCGPYSMNGSLYPVVKIRTSLCAHTTGVIRSFGLMMP